MHILEVMRLEVKSQYPDLKRLPWLDRIKAMVFGCKSEFILEWSPEQSTRYKVTAVIVNYNGKDYFMRWGSDGRKH